MRGIMNIKQTVSLPFVFIWPSTRMEKRDFPLKAFSWNFLSGRFIEILNKFIFILKLNKTNTYLLEDQLIKGAAEITPTFWRSIKIKRNKVYKTFFYL